MQPIFLFFKIFCSSRCGTSDRDSGALRLRLESFIYEKSDENTMQYHVFLLLFWRQIKESVISILDLKMLIMFHQKDDELLCLNVTTGINLLACFLNQFILGGIYFFFDKILLVIFINFMIHKDVWDMYESFFFCSR